jgi:prepilin-type processing-associated H-X9-DG protein
MYCDMLPKAEGGEGTNVLFGDGRVEWVTARQLAQLKAKGMPDHTRRQLEKPKP